MKRQNKSVIKQRQKFAIRKLNIGLASVLFGTFCYLAHNTEAQAVESTDNIKSKPHNVQQNNANSTHNKHVKSNGLIDNSSQTTEAQRNNTSETSKHAYVQQPSTTQETGQSATKGTSQLNNRINDEQQSMNVQTEQQKTQSSVIPQHNNSKNYQGSVKQKGNSRKDETKLNAQNNVQNTERVTRNVDKQSTTTGQASTSKATFNETIILPQTNARPVQVKEVKEQVYRKAVKVLKVGNKAQTLGASRGMNQARDSLGFIIPANTNLYVRQVKGNKSGTLRVNLVTNDSHFNKAATVNNNGSWTAIKTAIDSAAFIYMPRGLDKEPLIEYYVENNLGRALPTYRKGWNQKLFERRWIEEDSSYAYVDGTYNALLIPKIDRHHILNMKNNKKDYQFKNLDELITYYDDVITHYNKWAGLNDDVKSVNFNNESKYFTVANKHGGGLAYYSRDHIAANSPSIARYLTKGWLALHEVGHGYDGIMTGDSRMPLLEVWNNIFANQYQKYVEKRKHGWLYGNDQRKYQMAIHKRLLQNNLKGDFNKAGYKERLDFMTRMVRLTSIEGLTAMLQDIREETSKHRVTTDLPKWISEKWLAKYNANVLAYFNLYNIPVSKEVKDKVESLQQSYVYPLALLINDIKERQRYVEKLGLATEYELVRSSDLADSKIKTNAQVNLQFNGHEIAEGSTVKLIDGKIIVAEVVIQNGIAKFEHIRPGIYKVVVPHSSVKALPDHTMLIVREGSANNITVSYPNIQEKQSFYNQRLSLKGIGNREFVAINYNPGNAHVTINQYAVLPHNYFSDEYAHVTIIKQNGAVLLDESFVGKHRLTAKELKFELSYGDKIIVKHKEAKWRRILLRNETKEVIEVPFSNNQTVTYTLTDKGFKINDEADHRASGRYTAAIVKDIQRFDEEVNKNPNGDHRVRLSNLVQSINQIDEQYRKVILQRVKPYFDRFNLR